MDEILILKYNIDRSGRPYNTQDDKPQGMMEIHLFNVFETYETKSGVEKCFDLVNRRKILKLIIQGGSYENYNHLHDFLKEYSELWLKEFEKIGR